MNNNYLIYRPINSSKKTYWPAYLASKIRSIGRSDLYYKVLEKSIRKKLFSSENWAYKTHNVFKDVSDSGEINYRKFFSPSPSTSSAESYIINDISEILLKVKSKRVFSHILEEPFGNSNFKYYFPFYEKRNKEILSGLEGFPEKVVVFFDIKNFYNSIDKSILLEKLKLHAAFSGESGDAYINFIRYQLENYDHGVPIGTDLSHICADIYLENFDNFLESKFGCNYFRYVDDISIICSVSEVEDCKSMISSLLMDLGLSPNEKKYEVVDLRRWRSIVEDRPVEGLDFFSFCERVSAWADGDLSKIGWLESEFYNNGLQIPVKKIAAINSSGLKNSELFKNEGEVINSAIRIKESYIRSFEEIAGEINNQNDKWFLQKIKKTINPLFYLLNVDEYGLINRASANNKNLKNQEEVSRAIREKNCDTIVNYPGVTLNTFCEMWINNSNKNDCISIDAMHQDSIFLESAAILAMFGVVQCSGMIENNSLGRALRPNVAESSLGLPDFEAEIESLRIGINAEEQKKYLLSRYVTGEDIHLSALDLGNQSISE